MRCSAKPLIRSTVSGSTFQLFGPWKLAGGRDRNLHQRFPDCDSATQRPPWHLSTTYTAVVTGGSNGVKDLAGNALTSNFTWSFTTAAGTASGSCPCSVWSASATSPRKWIGGNDEHRDEVGVRFRSQLAGMITACGSTRARQYRNSHRASVDEYRNSAGYRYISGETGTGWQQVIFNTPVRFPPTTHM